jgi:flagellar hook protein FlgE
MASFSIPLSGLDASSEDLSVISNNLANMNTVGYKDETTNFDDLFYQQLGTSGNGNPEQVGTGVGVGSVTSLFTQGTIESTGAPTDVAIQGDGFFVVNKGGLQLYTRAGNFSVNSNGQVMTQDGAAVEGYSATNGVVNTNQTIAPLVIASGQTTPPVATANVQLNMNLNSSANVGDTFSTSETVYDSLGSSHVLTYNFTKTAGNTWTYNITIPAADVGQTGNPVSIKNGTLTFNPNGTLATPLANVGNIQITNFADGAGTLTFAWDLYDANNNPLVAQVSAPSAVSSTQQDGYASGSLVSFTIGSDGTIEGTFTNGQTIAIGQIALASFADNQGLSKTGNDEYSATLASGAANVGVPGTGGRGTLDGGSLEESNVDMATEFSQLILAERDYQANAKAVTTFDEVAQTAISLKQS